MTGHAHDVFVAIAQAPALDRAEEFRERILHIENGGLVEERREGLGAGHLGDGHDSFDPGLRVKLK